MSRSSMARVAVICMLLAGAIVAAALLYGCGGGGDGAPCVGCPPAPVVAPPLDAFFTTPDAAGFVEFWIKPPCVITGGAIRGPRAGELFDLRSNLGFEDQGFVAGDGFIVFDISSPATATNPTVRLRLWAESSSASTTDWLCLPPAGVNPFLRTGCDNQPGIEAVFTRGDAPVPVDPAAACM